ncbi:MAG: hypothetical protein EOO41_01360 [Methanobacteriota archaeon]|nr:MAG: hypothetical protein EOO41_01360 [Euryarchaeota archaeon]
MSAAESEIVNAPLAEESTVGAVDSNAAAGVGSTLSPSASAAAGAAGEGGRTGADGRKLYVEPV